MSIFVQHIVGQLQFLKGHRLFLELLTGEGWVGVHVEACGKGRVGFSRHQPGRAVVGVPVPLVVHGNNVHQDHVAPLRINSGERDTKSREHAPEIKQHLLFNSDRTLLLRFW